MTAKAGRFDCSAAKATFTARLGRRGVDRTVAQEPLQAFDELAVFFILHRGRSLAAVLQGRQLNVADHVLQAEFLDLVDRGFEPGLRRRVAQSASSDERGDLHADRRLGLLRGRLGRQDLLAGLQLRGRPLLVEFRDRRPETRRRLDLVQALDVFLQLLDRAVGHLEGVFFGCLALVRRLCRRLSWHLIRRRDDHGQADDNDE